MHPNSLLIGSDTILTEVFEKIVGYKALLKTSAFVVSLYNLKLKILFFIIFN
jgi:hypothetical protein